MVYNQREYLWLKGGVFYFSRHVPNDVQKHYERPSIVICLKTSSKPAALKASRSIASKLDDFWLQMYQLRIYCYVVNQKKPIHDMPHHCLMLLPRIVV